MIILIIALILAYLFGIGEQQKYIYLNPDENKKITEATFKSVGCVATIAISSALTVKMVGMSVDRVAKMEVEQISALVGGLPEIKTYCAVLAKGSSVDTNVYFSGRIASSENEVFEECISILPYCDEIEKLNGVCMECGSQIGNYSLYKAGVKTNSIEVGDINKYECVCRECYLRINKKL